MLVSSLRAQPGQQCTIIYRSILGLYWDNGKENGNYYGIFGLYRDNGKENGNHYSMLEVI